MLFEESDIISNVHVFGEMDWLNLLLMMSFALSIASKPWYLDWDPNKVVYRLDIPDFKGAKTDV